MLTGHYVVVALVLQFAATDGAKHSAGCLELLLKHGAKTGNSLCVFVGLLFHFAAIWAPTGQHDVDGLIYDCADAVDNEFDMTAWLWACDHGRSACLQPLIDAGASSLFLGHPLVARLLVDLLCRRPVYTQHFEIAQTLDYASRPSFFFAFDG